jgi:hypothetical protein
MINFNFRIFVIASLIMIFPIIGLGQAKTKNPINQKHPSLQYKTIECAELNTLIKNKTAPIIINCGNQANILGAISIGELDQSGTWKQKLRTALRNKQLDKSFNKSVVVYCGCCSSDNCPNVGPVIKELSAMGYKNVKGLYFFDGYGPEWKGKGYLEDAAKK